MAGIVSLATWADRKHAGDQLEERVRAELGVRGWTVDLLGQGAMSEPVTAVLGRTKSALRYLPEFIAARKGELCLIDCKGRISPHTGRHSISRAAIQAHLAMRTLFDLPIYYVFETLGVMTPYDVQRFADTRVGGRGGAYYLVSAAEARPFDAFFGDQQFLFPAA